MKITQLKCKQKYKQFKFLSIINSLKSELRFFNFNMHWFEQICGFFYQYIWENTL